ncbi:hypothetical protein K439DRAFT_345718 [Ramaria rubella]|nr:hypothetical protein K439DRAFT_345718 [Ramaria rubella]
MMEAGEGRCGYEGGGGNRWSCGGGWCRASLRVRWSSDGASCSSAATFMLRKKITDSATLQAADEDSSKMQNKSRSHVTTGHDHRSTRSSQIHRVPTRSHTGTSRTVPHSITVYRYNTMAEASNSTFTLILQCRAVCHPLRHCFELTFSPTAALIVALSFSPFYAF